jgi:hypothetical protein
MTLSSSAETSIYVNMNVTCVICNIGLLMEQWTLIISSTSFSTSLFLQMENQVIVSDYTQMDRVLREERQYILEICKKIKKAGCNVILIQKSILRYVSNRPLYSSQASQTSYISYILYRIL